MKATRTVQKILSQYEGETPGVKAQLCRMLMTGKLAGNSGSGRGLLAVIKRNPLQLTLLRQRIAVYRSGALLGRHRQLGSH